MHSLLLRLAALADRPLGTLVHVGSGASATVHTEAGLRPERLVLVEGDPEIGEELAREASGLAGVDVHLVALAPAEGDIAWHRYSLPALDGPRDAEPLRQLYPRLRRLSTAGRRAVGVADFLGKLPASAQGRVDALVLDVPGQEDTLCDAIPDDLLHRFGLVLVRGCREGAFGESGAACFAALARRGYLVAAHDDASEPLWPATLLRLDVEALLRARLGGLEAAAAQARAAEGAARAELEALRASAQAAQKQAQAREAELASLRRDLETAHDAVREARVAAESAAAQARTTGEAGHRAELDQARAEMAQLRGAARGAEERLQEMTRARDEHRQWHLENEKWAKSLKAENERQRETLEQQRRQIEAARESEAAAAARLLERDGRQRLMDQEILKAEAQLELIKDVLIREKNF